MTRYAVWFADVRLVCGGTILATCLGLTGCDGKAPVAPSKTSPSLARETSTSAPPTEAATIPENQGTPRDPSAVAPAMPDAVPLEAGEQSLLFEDFDFFSNDGKGNSGGTWTAIDRGLRCTGKPRGYAYTKEIFQDFTLTGCYRFLPAKPVTEPAKFKSNTGFLMYITGEPKLWPLSIEVQGKYAEIGKIRENGGAAPVTSTDDDMARIASRGLPGSWHRLRIESKAGGLKVEINGTPVSRSEPDSLTRGAIGIQSEDFPFEVIDLRVRTGTNE